MTPPLSKQSRNTALLVCFLCLVLCVIPHLYLYYINKNSKPTRISFLKIGNLNKLSLDINKKTNYPVLRDNFRKYNTPKQKFIPHEYSIEDWMELGLTRKQSTILKKFLKYPLRKIETLQKIYILPKSFIETIKDSILLVKDIKEIKNERLYPFFEKKSKVELVNLNEATIEQLEELKGIGFYLASKVVSYRNKLGGFVNLEQLKEIKQLDSSLINVLTKQIFLKEHVNLKLNINKISSDSLRKHPYISWNLANSIVKLRQKKGEFTSLEQLKESYLMSEDVYIKIVPYLKLKDD